MATRVVNVMTGSVGLEDEKPRPVVLDCDLWVQNLPAAWFGAERGTFFLDLLEGALAVLVALTIITTLRVASHVCINLLFEPWIAGAGAAAMAHSVIAFLVAGHDISHLRALLLQVLPGS